MVTVIMYDSNGDIIAVRGKWITGLDSGDTYIGNFSFPTIYENNDYVTIVPNSYKDFINSYSL